MQSSPLVRGLLVRGMLTGLAAGVLAFLFAKVFGEPQIDKALAFEAATSPPSDEPPLVSRGLQSTLGLLTATVVYAVALGGIFALVFAAVHGRIGRGSPRATAGVLALAGFAIIALVPFLKYPSNPPGVGSAETIGSRTELYFALAGISIVAALAALRLGVDLVRRLGAWNGVLAAIATYVALAVLAQLLMPTVAEIPAEFPTGVVWHFRVATLGTHAVVWATLGLGFGALAQRVLIAAPGRPRRQAVTA